MAEQGAVVAEDRLSLFCASVYMPWMRGWALLHPCQHLVLSVFEAIALLVAMKGDLGVVWFCVSLGFLAICISSWGNACQIFCLCLFGYLSSYF